MNRIRLIAAGLVLVSIAAAPACAHDAFRKAKKEGQVGYTDQKVSPSRAMVTFQGDAAMDPSLIYEYALLRAAQVTLDAGFDWFFAIAPENASTENASTGNASPENVAAVHEGEAAPGPYGDFTPFYDPAARSVSLGIAMGHGQKPANNPGAFDARALKQALKELK
jgi:hypothetical protein